MTENDRYIRHDDHLNPYYWEDHEMENESGLLDYLEQQYNEEEQWVI